MHLTLTSLLVAAVVLGHSASKTPLNAKPKSSTSPLRRCGFKGLCNTKTNTEIAIEEFKDILKAIRTCDLRDKDEDLMSRVSKSVKVVMKWQLKLQGSLNRVRKSVHDIVSTQDKQKDSVAAVEKNLDKVKDDVETMSNKLKSVQETLGSKLDQIMTLLRTADNVLVNNVAGYTYKGCFRNPAPYTDLERDGYRFHRQDMSVDYCYAHCKKRGDRYFSVQATTACFCGSHYGRIGASDACNQVCRGAPSQICGATDTGSVYRITA